MGRLFQNFFTHRDLFFDLFDHAAKNVVDMAVLLVAFVNTGPTKDREAIYKQIDKLENTGDDITHKIYLALDKVFFTPLNRSDIHVLASAIDDVADYIQEANGRMYLYGLAEFIPDIKKITGLILKASIELEKAVNLLKVANTIDIKLAFCKQVKHYEHESDQVYYQAVAKLFSEEKDAIQLIKYQDILHSLETTSNKCKNVTDALETILLK